MIESVCSNCGNKKVFEDDKLGKKYKCPSCSNTIVIEEVIATATMHDEVVLDVNEVQMNGFEKMIVNWSFSLIIIGGFFGLGLLWLLIGILSAITFEVKEGDNHQTYFQIFTAALFISGYGYMFYIKYFKKF